MPPRLPLPGTGALPRVLMAAPVAALALPALPSVASAQESHYELPVISINAGQDGSLTVQSYLQAQQTIDLTPGGVEVVPDTQWRDTPAVTIKDMLDYVPGVFAQPKWGEDTRLSIRGSGISRNAHLRGIQLYQNGIPLSSADGSGDFQEIDPTAFQYVEVFKGANGYQYGANALGGAINFVSPTGRSAPGGEVRVDGGAFGFGRIQANVGGVNGPFDGFITASYLSQDGFRQHSSGESVRGSANFGWQPSSTFETRFYLNATDVQQDIPGAVSKTVDYGYEEYGAFTRMVDERMIGGFNNRLVMGVNFGTGNVDAQRYTNVSGNSGKLVYLSTDEATTTTLYAEDNFYLTKDFALVGAFQYVNASLNRVAYLGTASGGNDYQLFLPKAGFIWELQANAQLYGNVSRSGEVPTFSELTNFAVGDIANLEAQTATTVEIGTRGQTPTFNWDVSLYRSWVQNELQCQDTGILMGLTCTVVNLSSTIHQGMEVGANWQVGKGLWANGPVSDSLWLNLAYTYSDFFFDNDPVWGNNQLPGIPRHYIRAELLYKHPSGFYAGPNVEWVPLAYYVDDANTLNTSPYALLNFRMGYDPGGRFSVYMDARNLLNVNYIASVNVTGRASPNQALFEPGNGRAIYVGGRMTF